MFKRKPVKMKGPGVLERAGGVMSVCYRPLLMWVLPITLVIGLCAIGAYKCKQSASSSRRYAIAAPQIFTPQKPPMWWDKSIEAEINSHCNKFAGRNIFDPNLAEEVGKAFSESAWVQQVKIVKKHYPNKMDAQIALRVPAAAVVAPNGRGGATYCLVSEDGVRLPKTYGAWPQRGMNVPLISGVTGLHPLVGGKWANPAVEEAIKIHHMLASNQRIRSAIRVAVIDVGNFEGKRDRTQSEITLYGEDGCRIDWGRATTTERPGEIPAKDKIAKLEKYLMDGNMTGKVTIDLRFAGSVVITRR